MNPSQPDLMTEQDLKSLSSEELLERTRKTVAQERRIQTDILRLLKEVERRRLFASLGFSSLFDFCVQELKYSESSAWRRISAMRLLRDFPEVEEKLNSGCVSLSTATTLQNYFRHQAQQPGRPLSQDEKRELVSRIENKSAREMDRFIANLNPSLSRREYTRALSETETEIRFIAQSPLYGKLERLKDLNSHRDPNRSYASLFDWLSDLGIKSADPLSAKMIAAPEPTAGKPHSRYIPVWLRKAVWSRDMGKCSFVDIQSGRVCGSTRFLEIDHVKPFGIGGKTELDNLRLYCRTHNQHAAALTYGENRIRPNPTTQVDTPRNSTP